jgi:hypothetical protein
MTLCPNQAHASTYTARRLPDLRYRRIRCPTLLMISPWAFSCLQSKITNTIIQQQYPHGRLSPNLHVWCRRQFRDHHACGTKYGVPNPTSTYVKNLPGRGERDQIAYDLRPMWRTGESNLQNSIWTSHFQTVGELYPPQSTMIGIP